MTDHEGHRTPPIDDDDGGGGAAASAGRTVELVVLRWEAVAGDPAFRATRLGPRVEALCDLGVEVTIVSDTEPRVVEEVLRARPSDRSRLRLRASAPGLSTVLDAVLDQARGRGVGPGLALLLLADADAPGPTFEGRERAVVRWVEADPRGAATSVLGLFDEQCDRRRRGRVPDIDRDPAWTVHQDAHGPAAPGAADTLLTLAAGGLGTRGVVEAGPGSAPVVLAAGVYAGRGAAQHLGPGPVWTGLAVAPPAPDAVRVLDLRTGVLLREAPHGAPLLRTLRFVSIARPGLAALRAEAPAAELEAGDPLRAPDGGAADSGTVGDRRWMRVPGGAPPDDPGEAIVAVAAQRTGGDAVLRTVERTAHLSAGRRVDLPDSIATLDRGRAAGFDHVLSEHRAAWAARWDDVDVRIPDDPAAQLALRFVLFQLWGATGGGDDELAVGARGVSGTGYAGHVFWDADVFVLPALLSIDPDAARAMVRYRIARLPAAREEARRRGRRGARFPWESAVGGEDVTPTSGLVGNDTVPVSTGELEEHITADVAWAAVYCARWTGDPGLLTGAARPLLLGTARYWASRVRVDADGRGHIDDVIGPDEYHEHVDDNAYTNVMARWNLRAAAALAERLGPAALLESGDDPARWRDLADRIVDLLDPVTHVHEQFVGYHRLQPLRLADVATGPVAADALLGRERVSASQLIKQPDVLMLHHLVPDEVAGSLDADLDHYGPRTAHGSSLSPATTAALLARAGRTTEALAMLRPVLDLDLRDLRGTTATGLHMATLGGAWQVVLHGFAGVSVTGTTLCVDPHLPDAWPSLHIRFRCLGRRIQLDVQPDAIRLTADRPLAVRILDAPTRWVDHAVDVPRPRERTQP